MSIIQLQYSTLANTLNEIKEHNYDYEANKSFDIVLLYKNKKIHNILYTFCDISHVICDIICDYARTKIKIQCYECLAYNNEITLCIDEIYVEIINKSIINISYSGNTILKIFDTDSTRQYNALIYNEFMKRMYGKCNYINYGPKISDDIKFIFKDNNIILMNHTTNEICGIQILDYKKFKHLIIKMKCITDGIHKFFSKN